MGFRGNPNLAAMAVAVVVLQLAVVYIPGLNDFFGVQALSPLDLAAAAGAGFFVLAVLEAFKRARR